MDAPVWHHRPESHVTAGVQQWMRERVREQPDLSLRELQQSLQEPRHLRLSLVRIWLALRQIGLPLKKIALRSRARQRASPAAAKSVVEDDKSAGHCTTGISGRECSDHTDDPKLWSCSAWSAGERSHPTGPQADSNDVGRAYSERSGGTHDHC